MVSPQAALYCVSDENVAAETNLSARIYLVSLVFPGVRELLPNTSCLETKSNALDAFQMPPGWIRLYK